MGIISNKTRLSQRSLRLSRRRLCAGVLALMTVGVCSMGCMAYYNDCKALRDGVQTHVRNDAMQASVPLPGEALAEAEAAPVAALRNLEDEGAPAADRSDPIDDAAVVKGSDAAGQADHRVTLKITAVGDCTFGGQVGSKGYKRFVELAREKGYGYFFKNVRQLFEADDLTVVNLEGPLTSAVEPGKRAKFIFKGDPECVNILTSASVELCNLANNHALDYGRDGLKETEKVLKENGIGYCGFSSVYNAEIKGVRVTALGFRWTSDRDDIVRAVSKARKRCDLLIVNMHWGQEGSTVQNRKQQTLGHAIIDAGADLIIGTHPHVCQGIEKYKGKYIVYSLGNFCFAGNANPDDKRCLIFQQTFSFNPGSGVPRADLTDAGINIIPASISSVDHRNDFAPVVLPVKAGAALLKEVAECSAHFTLGNTVWMEGNYFEVNGLMREGKA